MEEEAIEIARIINQSDSAAAAGLERVSKNVLDITQELRRQNGILYPADETEEDASRQ